MARIDYANIKLLVLDVDGVLTDGRIIITPAGKEIKGFHVHDGAGMKYWKRAGGKLAIISGRGSEAVRLRAEELDVDEVRLNVLDKLPAYEKILQNMGIADEQTTAIGDDLTDLPMLRRCGFPIASANAVDEVRQAAAYVTKLAGGAGCVREVVELILKKSERWDAIMSRYLP